jgi:colanic acid/amylovoran biosynthesis glycosyltransferase
MHVVCNESVASDWSFFPEFGPELRARVHTRPRTKPTYLAAAMLPIVLVSTVVRAPSRSVRYLLKGLRHFGPRVLRRMYHDAPLIVLGPDLVHFAFGSYAVGNPYLGDMLGCATCVSFQGSDLNYDGLDKPGYYDGVWAKTDMFHFLGDDLKRRALRRGYVPDGRDIVIRPGVDTRAFDPGPRAAHEGPVRILSIGRLHWKKGYDDALQAIRMVVDDGVDCRYRIIGDGEGRDAVLFDRSDLRLDDVVELLGPQPAQRVRDELAASDILLHAATSEGFCYAVVEAQAMEVPVVTSDADGLPENVADGETGFVVPRRNPTELALGVIKLARDPDLRARMGRAGRQRVIDTFAVDTETDGYEELYRRAVEHRGR